jgi:hypothetical protein
MPRARGWPRRGATWYATDSGRKRKKKFEKELTLAKRRRPRKSKGPGMPPMAYVEETPREESIQNSHRASSSQLRIIGIPLLF